MTTQVQTTTELNLSSQVSKFLSQPLKQLIGGKWIESASRQTFAVYNPATGDIIANVADGDRADIDQAVKAARHAFENSSWSKLTVSERSRLIWKLADLLEAHLEEFAELESLDNGKPVSVASVKVFLTKWWKEWLRKPKKSKLDQGLTLAQRWDR